MRATFAIDSCDREALDWAASSVGYDSDTVQDVMLRSVEKRFGRHLLITPIEELTVNGGEKPAELRDSRELRQDNKAGPYRVEAKIG